MKLNLSGLSIATLTAAAFSFPAAAALETTTPVTETKVSSDETKDQLQKLAMKCGKKYDMKRNGKDCKDCDGNCGANCFKN